MITDLEQAFPELNILVGDQRCKSERIPQRISSEVHHHLTSPSTSSTGTRSPRTMTLERLQKEWVIAVFAPCPSFLPLPGAQSLTRVQGW